MSANKPRTATGVALLRAAGAHELDPVFRNPDYLAEFLLPLTLRFIVRERPFRSMLVWASKRRIPGGYYFHIARTKHIDSVLQQCVKDGITQVVNLGAGFDTRAHRFKDVLEGINVIEVDHPATQVVKLERLNHVNAELLSDKVDYVPLDFESQKVESLLEFHYDPKQSTLFILEGICMYINPEAVDSVFDFIRKKSGSGSSVVFDYIFSRMLQKDFRYYGSRQSYDYANKLGSPYKSGFPEGEIGSYLARKGAKILSEYDASMLDSTYLRDSSGVVRGRIWEYTNIVHASFESE